MGAFDDLFGYRDIWDTVLKIRRRAIQFTGTGVSVADDPSAERTVVTITAGGAVDSVHGRTGAVVSAASDYDASEIDNDSGVSGATVAAALDALAAAGGAVDSVFGRTGVVAAAAGDYSASEVTNDSGVSGTNTDDALDALAALDLTAPTDPGQEARVPCAESGDLAYNTTVQLTATTLGFFNTTPVAKQEITGSGPVAALSSLLSKIEATGLVTDSTTNVSGVAVQTLCSTRAEASPGVSTAVDANWEIIAVFSTPSGWAADTVELCVLGSLDAADGTGHVALFDTGLADDGTGSVSLVEVAGSELSFTTTTSAWKKTGDITAIAANKVYVLQAEVYGDTSGSNNLRLIGAEIRQT